MAIEVGDGLFSKGNDEAAIYNLEQFILFASMPNNKTQRARLVWGERNGAARPTVFLPKGNGESGVNTISVGMAPTVFLEFMNRLHAAALAAPNYKDKIANLGKSPDAAEGEYSAKVVRNTIHFGKDSEGICWIGLSQGDIENVRFLILTNAWHHFYKPGTDEPISKEEGSRIETLNLIKGLRAAYAPYFGRFRPATDPSKRGKPKTPAATPSSGQSLSSFDPNEFL